MIKKVLYLIVVLCCVNIFCNNAFARNTEFNEENTQVQHSTISDDINYKYFSLTEKEWEKYFTKQVKKIRKIWKKEAILKDSKYKYSYVKVKFFVNKKGDLLNYIVKSSCVPKGDFEFYKSVENTIKQVRVMEKTPDNYSGDVISYSVNFNTYLSKYKNLKEVSKNREGIARIELSKNTWYFVLLKNKE